MTQATEPWVAHGLDKAQALLGGGPWDVTVLHGSGGGQYGSSVARLRSDTDSVIVKVIRRNGAGPTDPASWRRELDLYRSAWLTDLLPDGLALPECLGSTHDDEAAVLLLEDIPFDDRDARAVEWYGRLAERLARLTAAASLELPPWASRDFVGVEAESLLTALPDTMASPSPHIADVVNDWRPVLDRLPAAVQTLIDRLNAAPHGFNHLDAFSRNAAEVGDRLVLIDWAYAGAAPIGTDAAAITSITAMHGDVDADALGDLHRAVVDGFMAGLAAAGHDFDPADVEAAIEVLLMLRWTRFLTQIHAVGDDLVDIAESILGRPFDQVQRDWDSMTAVLLPLAEGVLART